MKRTNTLGTILICAGLLAACSAGTGTSEDVQQTGAAVTGDTASYTISNSTLTGFIDGFCKYTETTLAFSGGKLTLTPSTPMEVCLHPDAPTLAAAAAYATTDAISVAVPSVTVDAPAPFGPYTVSVTALAMSNLSAAFQQNALDVHADFSATLHMYSPNVLQPTFDVVLSDVSADALLGVTGAYAPATGAPVAPAVTDGSNGSLTVSLAIATPGTTTVKNCLFGACDSLVNSQLGNIASQLQGALEPQVQKALENPPPYTANPKPYAEFLSALVTYESSINGGATKGWSVAQWPGISNYELTFGLIGAPPAPSGCTESDSCSGTGANGRGVVQVSCPATSDALSLYWLAPNGDGTSSWELTNGEYGYSGMAETGAGVSEQFTFKVCATNAKGTTCNAPFVYTTPSTLWCTFSTGGLGGGVYGGGAPVKPCGGHICPQ